MADTPSIGPKSIPARVRGRLGDLKASVEHAESQVETVASKAGAGLRKTGERTHTAFEAANARVKAGFDAKKAETDATITELKARRAANKAGK